MCSLREAANEAYSATLAPIHTYLVRAAIRTSMFLLPDRTAFLTSIGETGAPCLPSPCSTQMGLRILCSRQCFIKVDRDCTRADAPGERASRPASFLLATSRADSVLTGENKRARRAVLALR